MSADLATLLQQLKSAQAAGNITAGAVENITKWLTEPRYAEYAPQVAQHIAEGRWKVLDDVFWTIIPFGTGGRRGKMYPIGSNAINDRTIGESAQGLADYVVDYYRAEKLPPAGLSCAIAYDTRHRSRDFAELCAGILAAAGFTVYFLDGFRSTPELSFAVRDKNCSCGIMVTASHNPPSDNAVKVYWSTGGQVLPPHDEGIIERVMNTQEIRKMPFADALKSGKVVYCQADVDVAFIQAVRGQSLPGPRNLKILYTPLHGVGLSAVLPALAAAGFTAVEVYGPNAAPDGDFPNVPNHVANPENPAVFDLPIVRAKEIGADLVLATDPDCDRLGCAAPLTLKPGAPWKTFTGNRIGALLSEYLCASRKAAGLLSPAHYVVKTLVTTELIRRIADSYQIRTEGNLHVGFKYIGAAMDRLGPERFVFGAEESHGFLAGHYARDKDAAVASMLLAELAARCKAEGQSLHEKLDAIFWQQGYHAETNVSVSMPGSEGMKLMQALMARFRSAPPKQLAGLKVTCVKDYLGLTATDASGKQTTLAAPAGDMVLLELDPPGNYAAVRPSGTEPKVKFYTFAYEPPELIGDLEETKREVDARLAQMGHDLEAFAKV
ncbi:MAG TPA: phospho-sugar mutase [Pirellulales bacterium]|jgi:phosphoglucomutase/phosphomannomutase|nr:phospho-sugar mutase [Pirellulales bacterium]